MTVWRMGRWTNRKRMWVDFPYDNTVKDFLKSNVPGARWCPDNKFWHFPLDIEVAKDIHRASKRFGVKLFIEPELVAWIKRERERLKLVLRPDDLDADVSEYLPWLRANRPDIIAAMERKPWQIPAVAFMVAQKRVLLADKPGLGKTLETIAALLELQVDGAILVVAPRTAARVTWPDEIRQWVGPDENVFIINAEIKPKERVERVKQVEALANSGQRVWVLLGPNYLRIRADVDPKSNKFIRDSKGKKIIRPVNEAVGELFSIKWEAVVVDESHLTLAGGSAGVGKTKWSAQRLGLDALTINPNGARFAISGTPFRGKTENLWGTLNWLDKAKHSSYWNWIKRHYGVQDAFHGAGESHLVKGDKIVDRKRFYESLEPYMVRRTKEEIQRKLPPEKRMPPKEYEGTHLNNDPNAPKGVWLELTSQQRKQYDKIVKDAMIHIDDIAMYNVNGALAEMTRFKQLANSCLGADGDGVKPVMPSNKVDWIVDFLKDRQEAGTKVIVASQFTSFLEMLSMELKRQRIDHFVYTGKTKDADRSRIKDRFQGKEGEDLFILLNTQAAGVSLTLDMADDVVICDSTWTPDDQEQLEDRAHRSASDRIHNVKIWYLYSLDTIDEDIAIVNYERAQEITGVIDDERDKSFVDRIIAMQKARQRRAA